MPVPTEEEPLLDDVDVGDLEGRTIDEYRAWKAEHTRADRFPGGESLDETARRYARAFRRLAERDEAHILVVCHEIPVRYALNAAAGSDDLDGPAHAIPNATPYLFDEDALVRAAARIEELVGPSLGALEHDDGDRRGRSSGPVVVVVRPDLGHLLPEPLAPSPSAVRARARKAIGLDLDLHVRVARAGSGTSTGAASPRPSTRRRRSDRRPRRR